jgi:hypothetical protein
VPHEFAPWAGLSCRVTVADSRKFSCAYYLIERCSILSAHAITNDTNDLLYPDFLFGLTELTVCYRLSENENEVTRPLMVAERVPRTPRR